MTIPAERRTQSIKLSVNYFISACAELSAYTFNYQEKPFSPDDLNLEQWIDVKPVYEMAGAKEAYMCQFDIYGRTRNDPFKKEIDTIKDHICNAFNVNRIKIYDFSDPLVPCDTGRWLIPINSAGNIGTREECVWMDDIEGIAHCSLRFRFTCLADLSGARYCASSG